MSEQDQDLPNDDEMIEIDWDQLQAAIDGLEDAGLDLEDTELVLYHLAALQASALRRLREEDDADEMAIAEVAADLAAFAAELAVGDDDLPAFQASEYEGDEDDEDDEDDGEFDDSEE
ncbi:MAG: hypothetical protein AAGC60_02730 [Acidobacteriota bacterium]